MIADPPLDLGDPPIIKIESPDAARALVARELARNPDYIKVWFIYEKGDDVAAHEAIVKAAGRRRACRGQEARRSCDGTRRREGGVTRRRGLPGAFGVRRAGGR